MVRLKSLINSEACASELFENLEEMFPIYFQQYSICHFRKIFKARIYGCMKHV